VISAACSLWLIDISWSSSQFTTINEHVIEPDRTTTPDASGASLPNRQ